MPNLRHYGSIATTQHALERAMRGIAKVTARQLNLARKWNQAGLLSDEGLGEVRKHFKK